MTASPPGPVGIVGLGLLGASLAQALKKARPDLEVRGVDVQADAREAAVRDGWADVAIAEINATLADCTIVAICVPLLAAPAVLEDLRQHTPTTCTLTDVVGIKGILETWAHDRGLGARFVGAHPMGGGDHGGWVHARNDLFTERPVAVCPGPGTAENHIARVEALWRAVGGRCQRLSAAAHDAEVALTSHRPYLAALAQLQDVEAEVPHLVGRGFLDATRHAAFDPEVMATVARANPALPARLRSLAQELQHLATLLEADDPAPLLELAARRRQRRALLSEDSALSPKS